MRAAIGTQNSNSTQTSDSSFSGWWEALEVQIKVFMIRRIFVHVLDITIFEITLQGPWFKNFGRASCPFSFSLIGWSLWNLKEHWFHQNTLLGSLFWDKPSEKWNPWIFNNSLEPKTQFLLPVSFRFWKVIVQKQRSNSGRL